MIKRYIISSLSDSILIFLGVFGAIFASVTAYNLELDSYLVILFIALASIAASFSLHLQKKKRLIAIIAYIVIFVLVSLNNIFQIIGGAMIFLNKLLTLFNKFNPNIRPIIGYNYPDLWDMQLFTVFFAALGCIGALLAAFALIKLRSVTACILFTLPIIAPALIFINRVPNIIFIVLYLAFIFGAALTNGIRVGKRDTGSGVILALPPLIMLILITSLYPPSQYKRWDIGQEIYNYLAQHLPLTTQKFSPNNGNVVNNPSTLSQYVDLNNSVAPTGIKSILTIKSEVNGTVLLRGYSFLIYNGVSWQRYNDVSSAYVEIPLESSNLGRNLIVNPFDSPTFAVDANIQQKKIEIMHSYKGPSIVYMPYLSVIEEDNPFIFDNESYFAIDPGQDHVASYTFNILNYNDISPKEILDFYSLQLMISSSNEDFLRKYNSQNRIYNKYLQIDVATREFLRGIAIQAGITPQDYQTLPPQEKEKLISEIAVYIENCAEYDINAPKTPSDENFVIYFMTKGKRGFCMHFATAATMMYRAFGIPARYVTGYSKYVSGSETNTWTTVREKNAHAWVEVYIDSLGWIPIDPTPPVAGVNAPHVGSETETSKEESVVSEPVTESEPEVSSEESSAVSEVSQKAPTPDGDSPNSSDAWIRWVLISASAIVIISIPFLRRQYKRKKRKKAFEGPTNKAAIAAWQYIERLKPYGAEPKPKAYDIALKAAFSNHTLTKEEADIVINAALHEANKIYKSLGFFKKIAFCYIKGLY